MKGIPIKKLDFIPLFSGILFFFSFSPFEFSYLSIVSLALLFYCWSLSSPIRAAFHGYAFGIGVFGFGVSWVYFSLHDYGGAGFVHSALLTGIFFGFWALFPAITGYVTAKLFHPHSEFARMTLLAVVWTLGEYVRGSWVLNGFPWLQIAYSQLDTPLAGFIPILGVYGTGMIAALSSALLVTIFISNKNRFLSVIILLGIWIGGGALKNLQWTEPAGASFKAALIQGNVSQDKKWQPENRDNILQMYRELTYQNWDSSLIVWPESAVPAFLHQIRDDFLGPLEQKAKETNTDVVISLPIKENGKRNYNAVITLGSASGIYRKIHLLPFGEYLPLQPFSGMVLNSLKILPVGSFEAGHADQDLLSAAGYSFVSTICYEDAFGDEGLRRLSEAAYLVNVTNDAWFGDSIEPYQHMQIARMRALETGRYLLRATNTGVTAVVSPDGKIVRQAPLFKTAVLTAEITPLEGLTPYARLGDVSIILVVMAMFLFLALFSFSCRD